MIENGSSIDQRTTAAIFTVTTDAGILSLDDHSVTFLVPDVAPAVGTLVLSAKTLVPQVLRCTGFAVCELPSNPPLFGSSVPLAAAVVP